MSGHRSRSRELAFQIIFGLNFKNSKLIDYNEIINDFETQFSGEDSVMDAKFLDKEYCFDVLKGIVSNKCEIDSAISENLKKWKLERLSKVDLSILRLATYEMCFNNLDPRITINEAINISKKYSNENSYSYINGILNSIKNTRLGRVCENETQTEEV